MSISTQWARIWNALESRKLMHSEAEDITAEVNRAFSGNITDLEMVQSIRDLCECRRTHKMLDGKKMELRFAGQCGANMLISYVRLARWKAKPSTLEEYDACICSSGWIMFTDVSGTEYAVPCLCAQGMKRLSDFPESNHSALKHCANIAIEQRKAYLRCHPYHAMTLAQLKQALTGKKVSGAEAWEMICGPADDRDCVTLERHAINCGYDIAEIKRVMVAELRELTRGITKKTKKVAHEETCSTR